MTYCIEDLPNLHHHGIMGFAMLLNYHDVSFSFILQLENKLRMVPSKLRKSERDLEQYQNEYDALQQLKPIKENVRFLYTFLLCCVIVALKF